MKNQMKNQMEWKKEYLNDYKVLYYKVKSLEEQKQSLLSSMQNAKSVTYSGMPKGNKQFDLSDYMVRLDELYDKIASKEMEFNKKRLDIEEAISDVSDGIESSILRKRYIELKDWETICTEIGYSRMQTHRHHGRALEHLILPEYEVQELQVQ